MVQIEAIKTELANIKALASKEKTKHKTKRKVNQTSLTKAKYTKHNKQILVKHLEPVDLMNYASS